MTPNKIKDFDAQKQNVSVAKEKAIDFLRRKKIDIAVSIPDWEIIKSAVYIACEETRKEVEKEFALTPLDYLARQEIKEIIIKNENKVRVETAKEFPNGCWLSASHDCECPNIKIKARFINGK